LLAKAAPELSKQLIRFERQRIAISVCGESVQSADAEILNTQDVLANQVLGDKAANWKLENGVTKYWVNCTSFLFRGIMVFVGSRASQRTMDAARALAKALATVLPPGPTEVLSIADSEYVDRQLRMGVDKSEPYAVKDPNLVALLIGGRPRLEKSSKAHVSNKH
jgi:hypothetical protein